MEAAKWTATVSQADGIRSSMSSSNGVARVGAERYGRDLTRISQEVLQHLAALDGVDLDITVEIRAHMTDGFPEDKVRVILENARALKFDHSTFESD